LPGSNPRYDVAVIGAGAGGVAAAIRAAKAKGRVVVFECGQMGGLCMNKGCIPLTHLMTACGILGDLSLGKNMGIEANAITPNFGTLLKRQVDLLTYMRQGVEGVLKRAGVEIVRGKARLEGQGVVSANGRRYETKAVVIASGGRWKTFGSSDAIKAQPRSIDELLLSPKLPKRVLLLGTSRWSIEAAQFLRCFGSDVALATPERTLLSTESKTISSRLSKVLRKEGINILHNAQVSLLEKAGETWRCTLSMDKGISEMEADAVFCLDRSPSIEDLGLEKVGLDPSAPFLTVNESLQTKAEGIYAIGDAAGPPMMHYSHRASAQGAVAAENAMGKHKTFDQRTTPRVLFTRPQIACVGLTPKEAKEAGYDVVSGLSALSMNPLGMILSQHEGAVEVVADKRYGEVLGIHIIGDFATEMIGLCALALRMEATVEELAETTFPHPTLSESIAEAARDCLVQSQESRL
jgi:dihydrolipoamide dehydrogenase